MGIGFCAIVAPEHAATATAAMPGSLIIGEVEPQGPCAPSVIFA
jgi:phosphoribosylaminoimidazole (AIR) synthetase